MFKSSSEKVNFNFKEFLLYIKYSPTNIGDIEIKYLPNFFLKEKTSYIISVC